jgi:hypothetical protein
MAMGMSVGEYDVIKKKLFIHFSRNGAPGNKPEISIPLFDIPKDVKEVELVDLDWDGIYACSVKHLKSLAKDDKFIYANLKDPDIKRVR